MRTTDINIDRFRSYANILSNTNFNRLIRENNYRFLHSKSKKYDKELIESEEFTYQDYFCYIFTTLRKNYRNEYIYKNYIIEKILLGRYSLNTTTALNEFRINNSIADLVLINGTSKVFEIKTELDNPDRLLPQLRDYKRVFQEIYVVTHHSLVNKYLKIVPSDVGIIILTQNFTLKSIRESRTNLQIEHEALLKCLRKQEYSNIILKHFGSLPKVSDFKFFSTCKNLVKQIPIMEFHDYVMLELKQRSINEKEMLVSNDIPEEIRSICLFLNLNNEEYSKLNKLLKRKIKI